MDLQELVLMPETQARRALSGQNVLLRVLAPVGAYAGCGTLRVLRLRPVLREAPSFDTAQDDKAQCIELVCGYEAYDRIA